ncbi:MAG: hypothetical protein R3E82_16090 [Pseudomonadales bacterium]|nr:sel1 repeat family protein [Pseudomonadales bacterium]
MMDAHSPPSDAIRARRTVTWFLTILLVHTIPVPFFAIQVAGLVPAIGLLALGVGSLIELSPEAVSLGMFALLPGLVFSVVLWALSAFAARRILARARLVPLTLAVIALICVGMALLPVYAMGGHGATAHSNLFGLLADFSRYRGFVIGYLAATAGVLGALLLELQGAHWPRFILNRWMSTSALLALAGGLIWSNHALLVCRPLALQGYAWAQYCVGVAVLPKENVTGGHNPWLDSPGERSWLEMAAAQGHTGALRLLAANTYVRDGKERWLRPLAEAGDAEAQFQLYRLLVKQDAPPERIAEGYRWVRLSAQALYPEAVEHLAYLSNSDQILAPEELRQLIERAAEAGMSFAQFIVAGWLDNPLHPDYDQAAARRAYQRLARDADTEQLRLGATDRLRDIAATELALAEADPEVLYHEARRRLDKLAQESTRREGMRLLERAAAAGQLDALKDLLHVWEHGGYGLPAAPERAVEYIAHHAAAGQIEAMELIAEGYFRGEHGFEIDYALAREWIDKLIIHYEQSGEQRLVENLKRYRDQIDRKSAGMTLRPVPELLELGRRGDAESAYQAAWQLALHPSRNAQMIELYERAAQSGHAGAHYELYRLLASDVEQYPSALSHLRTAAAGGLRNAQNQTFAKQAEGSTSQRLKVRSLIDRRSDSALEGA